MVVRHGKFIDENIKNNKKTRSRTESDVDVYGLKHKMGVASNYTNIVSINHPLLPMHSILAVGKSPFLDLWTISKEDDQKGMFGENEKMVLMHSWDIRKLKEGMPNKVKIYTIATHSNNK